MNRKKIMSGLMAGAVAFTAVVIPSVPAAAAYKATQTVKGTGEEYSETTLAKNLNSTWWEPNTFSNALKITDKQLKVTYTQQFDDYDEENYTDKALGNGFGYACVYSSTTGAIYGGVKTDESYDAGVSAKMVEYLNLRADGHVYNNVSGVIKSGGWDGYGTGNMFADAGYSMVMMPETCPWGDYDSGAQFETDKDGSTKGDEKFWDAFYAAGKKSGFDCTVTAQKSGNTIVFSSEVSAGKCDLKFNITFVPKNSNPVYICFNNGDPGVHGGKATNSTKNIKFKYMDSYTAKLSKTVFKYNKKNQKPSVTVTLKKESNTYTADAKTDDYQVTYSYAKSTDVGGYQVTITGLGDYKDLEPLTLNYQIDQINQTFKVGVKAKKLKAKNLSTSVKSDKVKVTTKKKGKKKTKIVRKLKKAKKVTVYLGGAMETQEATDKTKGTKKGYYKYSMVSVSRANKKAKTVKTVPKAKITASKKNPTKAVITIPKGAPKGAKYTVTFHADATRNYAQSADRIVKITVK